MKYKEKQIEEMAKDYYGYSIDLEDDCKFVAEEMYNKGHRKLPEDSVVLSKEEYEKLKMLEDCSDYENCNICPMAREGNCLCLDEATEEELANGNCKYFEQK